MAEVYTAEAARSRGPAALAPALDPAGDAYFRGEACRAQRGGWGGAPYWIVEFPLHGVTTSVAGWSACPFEALALAKLAYEQAVLARVSGGSPW